MGLTIIAFLASPLLAILALRALGAARRGAAARGPGAGEGSRAVAAANAALAAFSLLQGLAFLLVIARASGDWPLLLERASGTALLAAYLALLYFALVFPEAPPAPWRLAGLAAAAALAALGGWRILGSRDYAVALYLSTIGAARVDGTRYLLIAGAEALMGLGAAAALAARSFLAKDRLSRQRSAAAAAGIALGTAALWLLSGAMPMRAGVRATYGIMPLGALAMGAVAAYASGLERVFDWKAVGRALGSYALLLGAVGLPAGLAACFMGLLWPAAPGLAAAGTLVSFLIAYFAARGLAGRFLERVRGRGDYREELESELSHVELAEGREAVLERLRGLLCARLDFADFSVLVEDERGALRVAYSTGQARPALERGSALSAALESAAPRLLLRSEARYDPAYQAVRGELAALFDELRAEALVFAREGRHAIGAFALGPRLTGEDYSAYDLETLRALYGKLFVFAYYLKNVARQSLLHTVDRELALSDQVIHFALEKVDRVSAPGVDAAWTMRSTRRLGGDFVDFVRMSESRWFFVLGDVSGKGLSASMNMLILKSTIRTFLRVERNFTALVARVNAFIKENLPRGTFFAGTFGYFDFAEGTFYYHNCGLPALLLYSPALDTFIEVQGEGKVLGFVRDIGPYLKPRKVSLPPGSVLVAVTDGVTDSESLRGDRFGKDRLKRSVRDRLGRSARDIADGVVEDLYAFTDRRQEDDITLLAMKIGTRSAE
ncbi:MAG TPA: PP2C family protein-serine/threonine phosphatase [Spirochaetales bacterium]|nr:PP2C family protein-serine/threonine phosphatase [Spirochaetales bacterium]HRZ65149.1 PP2C family protein-serine/threonine phosphatase [Spirochaetia bacterium]